MWRARIPELDGIRGLAIVLVVLHNASMKYPSLYPVFANGWMGVDLFFVLSGFLITGILLDTKHTEGYFTTFYARRCLRIWPLYYTLIAFMFVVVPMLRPSDAQAIFERSSPWWAYVVFVQNFFVPNLTMAAGLLAVTWSLAIEEQFYLVWPWIVRYSSTARLRALAIAIIGLSPLLRYGLSRYGVDVYPNTFCRLDGLMAGAVLALLVRSETFRPSRYLRPAALVLALAVPLAFALEALGARWLVFSLTALASAAFLYLALFSARTWLHALLTARVVVYTGIISYGLYLLHKMPLDVAQALHLDRHPALALTLALGTAYALAVVSRRWLEQPFLRLKRLFEPKAHRAELAPAQLVAVPK